ncbi:hypothetical protein [Slackia exigua]
MTKDGGVSNSSSIPAARILLPDEAAFLNHVLDELTDAALPCEVRSGTSAPSFALGRPAAERPRKS